MKRRLILTSGLILALAAPALAQTDVQQPDTMQQQPAIDGATQGSPDGAAVGTSPNGEFLFEEGATEIRAEKLIGMDVTNSRGEKLATVRDVLLDKEGQITGIVVSTGGFLGFGAKPVAISWDAVSDSPNPNELTVELSKEQLAEAPAFKTKEDQQQEMLRMQPQPGQGSPATTAPSSETPSPPSSVQ